MLMNKSEKNTLNSPYTGYLYFGNISDLCTEKVHLFKGKKYKKVDTTSSLMSIL